MVAGKKVAITCPNDTVAEMDQDVFIKLNLKKALVFNGETKEFVTRHDIEKYKSHRQEAE